MGKVSILLAVYNGGAYIEEAIESILAQEDSNWELIIVNNGSTDNTQAIIERYAAADSRIFAFDIKEKGKNKAYNFAFNQSSGDIICFFAADDKLATESIGKRSSVIKAKNDYSTCCLKTFSEDKDRDGVVFPKKMTNPNYSGGSIMFSRGLASKIFPIPESLPNEDTWTSLHLRAFGTNQHLPEALYFYRIHNNNSFGYGLSFHEKREKYLNRMEAFVFFKEKWNCTENKTFDHYIISFVKGLDFCKNYKRLSIILLRYLPIKDKMVLFFYSSSVVYMLRHKFFKLFSGIIH